MSQINGDSYDSVVEVEKVECYARQNASNHRTDKYDLVGDSAAVLRRSAPFFLAVVTKSRPADLLNRDRIVLMFEFGPYPSIPKGTRAAVKIGNGKLSADKSEWEAVIYKESGKTLVLEVQIASAAPVGLWKCKVETASKRGFRDGLKRTFVSPTPLYILFNPYSKDDSVHLPNDSLLAEYIENDVGIIYKGAHKQPSGRQWIFGQFDSVVLPACCHILDKSRLRPGDRGNPVRVSRAISALVNSAGGDGGVIEGRWSEPYPRGTSPWDWNGSVAILKEYMEGEGRQPVRYGQCWVFSAVVVTVCRALGLPCRSVTNFVSAHDTNASLTVDKFFSGDGRELTSKDDPEFGADSIWNFHVWNDVWMARPDLPKGYGGWQAIDATPQELSHYDYQCGPASVEAIRRGEVGFGYDVAFVFAEVNADVCHFISDEESHWGFTRSKLNKYHVGRLILTKSAGSDAGEDVTWQYKNDEGTAEERLAVFNAVRGIDRAMKYYDVPDAAKEDVSMDLVDLESVQFGQPYKARVILENLSNEPRTLDALLSSSSIYYTGVTANPISRAHGEFVLAPGQKDTLALTVYPSDYAGKLVEYCTVKIYSQIRVKETKQTWSEEDDFILEKPQLKLEVEGGRLTRGRIGKVRLWFRNPLDAPLTRCRLSVECPGMAAPVKERVVEVPPGAQFAHTALVSVGKAGRGVAMLAAFSSEEMIDVHGSCKVDVVE